MDENSLELMTGLQAVRIASQFCQRVRNELTENTSLQKSDRTPVTIADYGAQAIICKMIRERFPKDPIVAEEDSKELREPTHSKILEKVTHFVNLFIPNSSSEEICSWIDFSSNFTGDRFWTLDPIDGTKGFLRGDQYAIALALIENGIVKLGLLACPNLYVNRNQPDGERGCLFFALRGKGAFQIGMDGRGKQSLSVSKTENPEEASFTESVEPDHADHLFHQRVAQSLNIQKTPLKIDSQVKYGIVARGEVTFYLRVPSPSEPDYKEKIWDHAAGTILVEEAGGKVTDISGNPIDFSCGIRLEKNRGILVSNGILHDLILKAFKM
ncbi:MAG: 3'(2'),5'-bisphosphate nucleotidase [Thermodesulfobacteriota bacterium]